MPINPLQLPDPVKAPLLDFTPLNRIGDAIGDYRMRQQVGEIVSQATGPDGKVDAAKIATSLAQRGYTDQARPYMALAESQANAARAQANSDRSFRLQENESARRANESQRDYDLRVRALNEGRTPPGFQRGPDGGMSAIPGGPSDPAYIQKTNEAKDKGIQEQIRERELAVRQRGLDANDPNIRAFILTGKMPREDQQPLSATDKKFIAEADEGVLSAENAISSLGRAIELSPKALAGPLAGQIGYGTSLFGSESGKATTNLTNEVMTNALGQLKAIFGGNPTEGERKIMLELQGSVNQPNEVRIDIYNRAKGLAEKRLEFNRKRAEELRGGTFYKPAAKPDQGGQAAQPSAPAVATREQANQAIDSARRAVQQGIMTVEQANEKLRAMGAPPLAK